MTPRTLSAYTIRKVPLLHEEQDVGSAVEQIVDAGVPALPVVDAGGALRGIFGEREFISAVFPGYLGDLHYAGFVTEKLEDRLEKRASCRLEPISKFMNTEHVEVSVDHSDVQLAETFMHHRVLIIPVVEGRQVTGIVTRRDFFEALVRLSAEAGP